MNTIRANVNATIGFGYLPRAPYATHPEQTRGRLFAEPDSATRTPFQRDRDRIIHSNAFRRLKHKTQVFIAHEGDHYRTRLTHSIEVAQIARALARSLKLDEDLAEAIALAHDLGHPPFGHAGEAVLDEKMRDYGGFDHNAQALKIVTFLEKRYPSYDGLNLSWETLEGLVKHNGPLTGPDTKFTDVPYSIKNYNCLHDLELDRFAGPEAQCAAVADDVAYDAHDIDDGLRSGLLTVNMMREVPLTCSVLEAITSEYPAIDDARCGYELVRRQITLMIEDIIAQTQSNLLELNPNSVAMIYAARRPIVTFSQTMGEHEQLLKRYLYKNLYFHPKVTRRRKSAEKIVSELFDFYIHNPQNLPEDWKNNAADQSQTELARHICDYISGMTDNYAIRQHQHLFDLQH